MIPALEMFRGAVPSPMRAAWCVKMHDRCLSVLIDAAGDVKAAAALDAGAQFRNMDIVEICRVQARGREAAYALLQPKEPSA